MKSRQLELITQVIVAGCKANTQDLILARQVDRALVDQIPDSDLTLLVRVAGPEGSPQLVAEYGVDVFRILRGYLEFAGLMGARP